MWSQPFLHGGQPRLERFGRLVRSDEVLDLHLLELEQAEDEVARRNLVPKRLSDLGDAKRHLDPSCGHDVLELHEHRLRRLRSQVDLGSSLLDRPDHRAEHHVELARAGQRGIAADRTLHRRVLKNPGHLVGRRALDLLPKPLLDQVIGSEPALAGAAVDQRVIEALDVPRRLPNAGMHQNAGIEADDVPALVHESAPPEILDIAFELDAERPVVPGICQTAIDIRAREDESAALAERGDLVHGDDARLLGGAHRFCSLQTRQPRGARQHRSSCCSDEDRPRARRCIPGTRRDLGPVSD